MRRELVVETNDRRVYDVYNEDDELIGQDDEPVAELSAPAGTDEPLAAALAVLAQQLDESSPDPTAAAFRSAVATLLLEAH